MNIIETSWNWNGTLSTRAYTDYIALHHAECSVCSAADVHSWHKNNGWCGIGYHFFVRKNGEIYRGRPLNTVGSHVLGMNNRSIGICAEGAYMKETMPYAQKLAIAQLLDYLKTNYYPNAKIVGHREIGDSDCPGKNFPLEELKNYKNILKGADNMEFKDVNGHYAKQHINDLLNMGVVNGDDNGNFNPDKPVTRADAAIMVRNAIRYITGK